MRLSNLIVLGQLALGLTGCAGYATASELRKWKQGPDACEERCRDLGMRMGALALIDTAHAGCVCIPAEPAAPAPAPATTPAAPAAPPSVPAAPESAPEPPSTPAAPAAPTGPAPEVAPAPSASIRQSAVIAATGMLIAEEERNRQNAKQQPYQR